LLGRRQRRLLLAAVPIVLLGLAFAGAAFAGGNAGFAPEPPHSPNAQRITDAYWLVFGFTAAVFLLVEGALITFIVKYRRRGRARTTEGAQVHGHTRLELIWTVIPVLILVAIAGFIFYKLPGISDTPAAAAGDRVDIRVDAHQFYWQFTYPDGQVSIADLHVPVGKVVYLEIHAQDVIHSFWVPQLGGKTDAIPGRTNHTWFKADKVGTFEGRCAEMCGLYHAKMPIHVIAEPEQDYQTFLASAPQRLGKAEFEGVCQTCHGLGGKGGYGPTLAGNPLTQQAGSIAQIVRNGGGTNGRMPPVGRGWTDTQMTALTDYLRKNLGGSASGG
jgi:cytochrome c oxidase subunit 2